MATLYVTEFTSQGQDLSGRAMPVAKLPANAEQTVAISGSSAQSSAFNNATNLIRVHTDSTCSIELGSNPTATTSTARMYSNQTEYFEIPSGLSWKIAVISNT